MGAEGEKKNNSNVDGRCRKNMIKDVEEGEGNKNGIRKLWKQSERYEKH